VNEKLLHSLKSGKAGVKLAASSNAMPLLYLPQYNLRIVMDTQGLHEKC